MDKEIANYMSKRKQGTSRKIEYKTVETLYSTVMDQATKISELLDEIIKGIKKEKERVKLIEETGKDAIKTSTNSKQKRAIREKIEKEKKHERYRVIFNESIANEKAKQEGKGCPFWKTALEDFEEDPPNKEPYLIKVPQKIEENQWNNLKQEQQEYYFKELTKILTITYAKEAKFKNIQKYNGEKKDLEENQKQTNEEIYNDKDIAIKHFLKWAKIHNELVPEEKQIYYGFERDKSTLILDINVPGDDKIISLHIPKEKLKVIINELSKEEIFKKNIIQGYTKNIREIEKKYKYAIGRYIVNTGLPCNHDYKGSKKEAEKLAKIVLKPDGKVDSQKLDFYINVSNTEYNASTIMYLANKAEFGKENLKKIDNYLWLNKGQSNRKAEEKIEDYIEENGINGIEQLEKTRKQGLIEKDIKIELYQLLKITQNKLTPEQEKMIENEIAITTQDYDQGDIYETIFNENDEFLGGVAQKILQYGDEKLKAKIIQTMIQEKDYIPVDPEKIIEKIGIEKLPEEKGEKLIDLYIQIQEIEKQIPIEEINEVNQVEKQLEQHKNNQTRA